MPTLVLRLPRGIKIVCHECYGLSHYGAPGKPIELASDNHKPQMNEVEE